MSQPTDPRIDAFLAEARRDPEAMLITVLEHLATTRRQLAMLAEVNRAQSPRFKQGIDPGVWPAGRDRLEGLWLEVV